MFEQKDLLTWWTVKGFKGIVINRALPSLHGGSLEIILTVPLQGLLIFLNIHNTQIFGLESTSKVFCLVFLTLMKDVTKALRQVENIFAHFAWKFHILNASLWKIFLSEYNSFFLLAIPLYELLKNEKDFLLFFAHYFVQAQK